MTNEHTAEPDLIAANHGSLWLLHPVSDDAEAWLDENLGDDALRMGGAVAVEHRCVAPILDGLRDAGLRVD